MRLCVRWDPAPLSKKEGVASPQIFGPCLLWPNGWMDQDGTWHGGRPQPRRPCGVRWGPSPLPKKGAQPLPNFWPVSIVAKRLDAPRCHLIWSPGDFVLDRDPAPSPIRGQSPLPNFRPMTIVTKRLDGSRWHLTWRWALIQATLC